MKKLGFKAIRPFRKFLKAFLFYIAEIMYFNQINVSLC